MDSDEQVYGEDHSDQGDPDDILISLLSASGFKIVPLQSIIDALAEMEQYICNEAEVTQNELETYLERVEELVGKEEAMSLGLDDIVSWIRAIRGS